MSPRRWFATSLRIVWSLTQFKIFCFGATGSGELTLSRELGQNLFVRHSYHSYNRSKKASEHEEAIKYVFHNRETEPTDVFHARETEAPGTGVGKGYGKGKGKGSARPVQSTAPAKGSKVTTTASGKVAGKVTATASGKVAGLSGKRSKRGKGNSYYNDYTKTQKLTKAPKTKQPARAPTTTTLQPSRSPTRSGPVVPTFGPSRQISSEAPIPSLETAAPTSSIPIIHLLDIEITI